MPTLSRMHPERVETISNIKATAWTTLILFSLGGYLVFSNYVLEALVVRGLGEETNGPEVISVFHYVDRIMIISIVVVLYAALVVYSAVGLLRLRMNGLILFHATTILLIIMMIIFVGYSLISFRPKTQSEVEVMMPGYYFQLFRAISYETTLLVFAWVLVKVNRMLMRKEYRQEFSG